MPYKCTQRKDFGFPTQIQGYEVDLYTYVPLNGDVHPDFLALSQNLKSITEKSLAVYLKYGKLVNLKFLLSNEMPADAGAIAYANWFKIPDKGSCNIVIYFNAPVEELNKTVAHEIAHCYQAANLGIPLNYETIDKWWVEGGAEYLATLVYPDEPKRVMGFTLDTEQALIL
ncbi:MAG: hypothetical protein ACK41T_11635 [Pseudobdellovibrio sp.]